MTNQHEPLALWSTDELCEHAFTIFEEVAADNLTAADFALYQQHADSAAYVELATPVDDWNDLTGTPLHPDYHIEAHIGLAGQGPQGSDLVLARILLSRDQDESLCHARWRGQ